MAPAASAAWEGCAWVPGRARSSSIGPRSRACLPWRRRPPPIPRPRSGTGTTWTAASPATASASPSACGSAPPPAGSPPTRCNRDRDLAAPGLGRVGRGGNGVLLPAPSPQLTPSWKPRRKRAEREAAEGSRVPGFKLTFLCRLKSDTFFWIPHTGRLGSGPAGGSWVVQCAGPRTGNCKSWVLLSAFPYDSRCELGKP